MAKWKDRKRHYSDKEPDSSEIRLGRFKLSVHRHIDYPQDQWLASSTLFHCVRLASKDIGEAKNQAKAILQVILEEAISSITE